ncbi:cytochrome c [Halomonas sp. KAO]|uniref:c-type cytochrome n=1 Tax=Halomonas sp. KAO TaxID=2783858 RepID=UPI0018A09855|nr:cytochrome c [Halomonas sp. KAO]MBF7054030.1 cytochrome c [Halomonas sp. KAO]
MTWRHDPKPSRKPKKQSRIKNVAGISDTGFDPHEPPNPIPWQVFAIAFALAIWGIVTLITTSEMAETKPEAIQGPIGADEPQASAVAPSTQNGRQLFIANCSTCHQNNGAGIAKAVPPLVGSRYVMAAPEVPVNILLFGIQGEISVAGDTYNGRMPTFGHDLDNEQIAAVVNHVRNSWGNQASSIDASFVDEQRQRSIGRRTPWAGGRELAETFGIPASLSRSHTQAAATTASREEAK